MKRISELDGLRAIAIALVLGCHYPGFAGLLGKLPEFGWVGVDIFFVLSGYLITTILLGLRHRPTPYGTFYSRRIIRIFPPYFAALLLIILLGVVGRRFAVLKPAFLLQQLFFLQAYLPGTGSFFSSVLFHLRWNLTHLPSLWLHAGTLPPGEVGLTPVIIAAPSTYWSLSIEEYFYLLWAPVVLRCSRRWILLIGVGICLAEMLLRWMAASPRAYFNLFFRFDALVYGAFLALLLERWRRTGTPPWAARFFASLLAFSALVVAAVLLAIRPVLGLEIRASPLMLVVALPFLSVASGCVIALLILKNDTGWWLARMLQTRPFQYIGTISYTMYLVHIVAAILVLQGVRALHFPNTAPWLQGVLASLLTIGLARLSWHFLEKPLLRWKDRRFPSSPHPPEPTLN